MTAQLETFAEYLAEYDALDAEMSAASKAWNALPGVGSGTMGLTPDAVKFSPAYKAASSRYNRAHSAMRALNKGNAKRFRREMSEEAARRRALKQIAR